MLLNVSPINATVINGSVGDYKILIGSLFSNATTSYIPVALIKPFGSSIDITALASCYPSVHWVLAANVSVTATDSSVLYKTSVLDGIDGSVVTTVYGSLNKTDVLGSIIDVVATCSEPLLTRYTWFKSGVTATASTIADILKVDNLSKSISVSANALGSLAKTDWLSGNLNTNSTIYNQFFKVVKNIATSINVDSDYESILSLIVNMDSDVMCSVVVPNTNIDLHKNLFVSNLVSAIISNSHLKHLYTQSGLDLDYTSNNIVISNIEIENTVTDVKIDYTVTDVKTDYIITG